MPSRTVTLNIIGDASKGTKALDDVAGKSEQTAGRSSKAFGGFLSTLNSTGVLGPFGAALGGLQTALDTAGEHGKAAGAKMLAIGGVAVGLGATFAAMGSKDQAAMQQLKTAIDTTGGSFDEFKDAIEKNVKVNEKFGFTANQSYDAIRTLTTATGDTGKGLDLMGVAANLAAAKHISLTEAASMLAKVHGGATKVLKEFGITAEKAGGNLKQVEAATKAAEAADVAATKAKENLTMLHERLAGKTSLTTAETQSLTRAEEAVKASSDKASEAHSKLAGMHGQVTTSAQAADDNISKLAQKLDGQAGAAANTFGGRMKAIKTEIEDTAAKLGQKYGPAIMAGGALMSGFGAAAEGAAGIMGKFRTAQEASTVATEALTVAEGEEVVAEGLALGPILLIIAAVALLAGGIYLLVTHWKEVWTWIKEAVATAVDWIKEHWDLILPILLGPFGLVIMFVKDHFHEILDIVVGVFNNIVSFITGLPGRIIRIAEDIGKGLANGFIWGINQIIAAWDWLVGFLKIPGFDIGPIHFGGLDIGSALKIDKIPYLAQGGIVTGPTLAMLGEAGPEAVIPLPSGGSSGAGGGHTHEMDVYLDGKLVGHAVAGHVRDGLIKQGRGLTQIALG